MARSIHDTLLGRLTFEHGTWVTPLNVGGVEITMVFLAEDGGQPNLEAGRALLRWLPGHLDEVKGWVADELLEIKNSSWVEDPSEVVDRATFVDCLDIMEVEVDAEGGCAISFHDGGLFWDHLVAIVLDSKQRPGSTFLAG